MDVTGLPNWFEKQVINVAPQAAGCDHGGFRLYPQGGRAQAAPSWNYSPGSFARLRLLPSGLTACICHLLLFFLSSSLLDANLSSALSGFQNLGTVSLVASPVPSAKMVQILSVAQRPPRSPHVPRVRPQLAL